MIENIVETGSTNAELVGRLQAGEAVPEGYWLVADRQTAGRGRQGRAWSDGHGNFMGSTVVHGGAGDPPLHTLALVAGLALQAVAARGVAADARPFLKWPNDLMIGHAKIAGILLERTGDAVVVGIGVNLAVAPQVEGRETAALVDLGFTLDRDGFANELAASFAAELRCWRQGGLDPVVSRWQAVAHPPGTPIVVGEPGEVALTGTFAGLDRQGALILARADGTRQSINAGEVRLA